MSRRILGYGAAVLLAVVTAWGGGVPAAAAGKEPVREHRLLRLCDPTACYLAWRVVDSDHDGVADADEKAAGTDPHDPASRPPLAHLAELAKGRALPSFAYGMGAFTVFPAEVMAVRERLGIAPEGAFPLRSRADTLAGLGVSENLLTEYGIKLERDGFSLGVDGRTAGPGTPPGVKLGRLESSVLSAGRANPHAAHGGLISSERDGDGGTIDTYADRTTVRTTPTPGGSRGERRDGEGLRVVTWDERHADQIDGTAQYHALERTFQDPDGRSAGSWQEETRTGPDGSTSGSTTTTQPGENGGTTVTGSDDEQSGDGTSHGENNRTCDDGGEQCGASSGYTEQPSEYVDPDAAYGTVVTQETLDGVIRVRGAAVTVVQGWNAPGMEGDPDGVRNPSTIMLVDDTTGTVFTLGEPTRLANVPQPEFYPDLEPPRDGIPPRAGGGCGGLC